MMFYQLACSAVSFVGYLLFASRIMVGWKRSFLLERLSMNLHINYLLPEVVHCDVHVGWYIL